MKKTLLAIFSLFCVQTVTSGQDRHVILISIDGLRPEFYKDPSWNMVNLRQAMREGVYADGVDGVFPTVTYPSHTTMITGVKPLKHGVYYNTPSEPLGITAKWIWDYNTIKTPTIFSAAKDKGLKTASVYWPVSFNSPATYNFPEYWYLSDKKTRVTLKALKENTTPAGLYEELENNAFGKLEDVDFSGDYLGLDENLARAGCYLIRKYKPSFVAIHLVMVDHFEHEEGRDGDKVRAAIASVDHAVKSIREAVDIAGITKNTTIIVTGDHGFVDIHATVAPNVLLAKAGLYDPQQPANWKAYFHTAGGGCFLQLKDKNDKPTRDKVLQLLKDLPAAQRQTFLIKTREELDEIGADPTAAFGLAGRQGYAFTPAATGEFIRPAKGGTHGFYPDFKEIQTGFVAFGSGIRKGGVIPQMGLVDIAPLISQLLGLDMPAGDGLLLNGVLTK
ncbi:alkaline phosphatase family protein [Chitinophaga sp. GCM10012297]|uniref:Alkaline phosphatase family protein n=1 Tax=Chitinophaga chungangae TaxID=2821488 RepID=A0ABS3YAC5_9BACT|nr:alkaline phosphatase family protein [Chitinophaga chungangae]MBO9151635.1 alkaline phosphatase family protein [Chitinophaga chungangae]